MKHQLMKFRGGFDEGGVGSSRRHDLGLFHYLQFQYKTKLSHPKQPGQRHKKQQNSTRKTDFGFSIKAIIDNSTI
jgi:hypothetical protein